MTTDLIFLDLKPNINNMADKKLFNKEERKILKNCLDKHFKPYELYPCLACKKLMDKVKSNN